MIIGIDASRAFVRERTGIEEYSFRVIQNLINELKNDQVILYVRSSGESATAVAVSPLRLPENWKIKKIKWPFFWTQIGLSLEMLLHPVDTLFVPSHVAPFIHPKNTIVTIHGLEYEFFPEGYSFWERLYMRWSIKASCRWAKKIIAVSENTKKDLVNLYKVPEDKIKVIYEGISSSVIASEDVNDNSHRSAAISLQRGTKPDNMLGEFNSGIATVVRGSASWRTRNDKLDKYLIFVGRLESRKNIIGIIQAFEILKEKYKIPHQLILAGKSGHGYEKIARCMSASSYLSDIEQVGFVSEEKKRELLQSAEVFLFPSFYEGFGLPILEAQAFGVPLITSTISSMPEVAGSGASLIDPNDPEQIAAAVHELISDKALRDDIIKKGQVNVQRFSWSGCGAKIAKLLVA